MAQIIFYDVISPFRESPDARERYGRYAVQDNFKHKYTVKYQDIMNEAEFMNWIVMHLDGIVMICNNDLYFIEDSNVFTLDMMFSGTNQYGDKKLWQWHKTRWHGWQPWEDDEWIKTDGCWEKRTTS